MNIKQLGIIFNEILEYQMDNVPLAKTTAVYKLAEKGLSMLTQPPIEQLNDNKWEISFKNSEGETATIRITEKQLLENTSEEFLEMLEDTKPCMSASCNNESQNFCDCSPYFEDYEIVGVRPLTPPIDIEAMAVDLYTKEQVLDAMGYCAAMDNTRPIHHLKEEAEDYIENRLVPHITGAKDMLNAITNPTKTKQPAKIAGH